MYTTLAIQGYRSLRDIALRLDRVTVITGGNGSGKSDLHKALHLIASCTTRPRGAVARDRGRFVLSALGRAGIAAGIPSQDRYSCFNRDPEIKCDAVWLGPVMRPGTTLARRNRGKAEVKIERWQEDDRLATHESLLGSRPLPELPRCSR